jgi:hypothetical protein
MDPGADQRNCLADIKQAEVPVPERPEKRRVNHQDTKTPRKTKETTDSLELRSAGVATPNIPGAFLTQRLHASLHYLGASAISRLLKNSMAEPIFTTKTQRHQEKLTKFKVAICIPWCLGG